MISLSNEVDQITKQYHGLLMPGLFNHLRLQSYEQELTQKLATNEQLRVMGKTATLLLYHSRYMFRNQFLLYQEAVTPDFELLCIAFFVLNKESDSLDFTQFCLLTKEEWQKATLNTESYRSFNLRKLLPLNLKETTPLTLNQSQTSILAYSSDSNPTLVEKEELQEECDASDVPATQFHLFWLHESLLTTEEEPEELKEISPHNEYLLYYIAFLIDVYVWQRYFTDSGAKLKKRVLQHYATMIGEHHTAVTLLFISQMIEYSSGKLTASVHQQRKDCVKYGDWFIELSETRLYKQWLEAELFLFKNGSWHKDLTQQTQQLKTHIHYIHSHLPTFLYPNWFAYALNERGEYWRQIGATLYEINGNWLFKPEFNELVQTLPLEKGLTRISTQIFQTVFMPTLYRCLLEDVHRCLFYLYHQQQERGEVAHQLLELRERYHYRREMMREIEACLSEANLASATSIFDCIATLREGNVNSPATKKMLKKRSEFDLSRKQSDHKVAWYERVITRNDVPDIEELGNRKLVPPCMQQIFRTSEQMNALPGQPRLGHQDKMNVVQYLIDLAYTKSEVVHFLGEGWQHDPAYLVEIASKYDSFSRKKRLNADQRNSQHHSFYCSSIINTVPVQKEKNWLRCPYADEACAGGVRRKDFQPAEKVEFMKQCGQSLSRPNQYGVKHPVQWTLSQLDVIQ